jgi:hypothetical protein
LRIFTSFWMNQELGGVDAVMVSTSRGRPRWSLPFSYRRLDELAPGDAAWREQEQEAFEGAYRAQLEALGVEKIVSDLEGIGDGRPLVALCWEKPGQFCHRRLLADFLEREAGIVVPELRAGMLPQREDVTEQRLF